MKNKFLAFWLTTITLISFFSISVSAYIPESYFHFTVEYERMPENAVYIDLLLPISVDDDGYVPYNEANGEKYNISKDSEIVNYCEDGYRSYTFHISDAQSSMRPHYISEFWISNEVYLENQDAFAPFESDCTSGIYTEAIKYTADIGYKSEKEELLNNLSSTLRFAVDSNLDEMELEYNCDYKKTGADEYGFEYCCKKYKYAKVAYLNDSGDIIAVSNETEIYKRSLSDVRLNLLLIGTRFSSRLESVIPWFVYVYVIAAAITPFALGLGFLIAYFVKKKFRKSKNKHT